MGVSSYSTYSVITKEKALWACLERKGVVAEMLSHKLKQ